MRVQLRIGRETILLTSVCLCLKEVTHEIGIPSQLRYLTTLVGRMLELNAVLPGAYLCDECSALVYAQLQGEFNGEKGSCGSSH